VQTAFGAHFANGLGAKNCAAHTFTLGLIEDFALTQCLIQDINLIALNQWLSVVISLCRNNFLILRKYAAVQHCHIPHCKMTFPIVTATEKRQR
jgi:hypothetical protein